MLESSKWLLTCAIVSIGCSQSYAPTETQSDREELDIAGVGRAESARPEGCDCKLKAQPARARDRAPASDRAKGSFSPPAIDAVDLSHIDLSRSPAKGPDDAAVTMVVFCDFECPYCRRATSTLDELERTYGASLRIVFKQLPLPFHEHARLAAKASLVAHDHGKFWQFHAALFEIGTPPDRATLDQIATGLGLDARAFGAAIDSDALDARVAADLADAARVGIRGTPTFVINGKKIVGAQPLETFEAVIDDALGTEL